MTARRHILRRALPWRTSVHERRMLPAGRIAGPLPWVIAIMVFLSALAIASGVGMGRIAASVGSAADERITVQIVDADQARRGERARRIVEAIADHNAVASAAIVPDQEVRARLSEWLGGYADDPAIPVPALVDIELKPGEDADANAVATQIAQVDGEANVSANAEWLGALTRLVSGLAALSGLLVLLLGLATIAVTMLAMRSAVGTHYRTIEILHLIGATDAQVARLFERRVAIDALIGAAVGLFAAMVALALIAWQFSGVGGGLSELAARGGGLPALDLLLLGLLPVATVLVTMVTAHRTLTRAMGRML